MTFQEYLSNIDACSPARQWVGDRTFEQAWRECERADWMCWIIQKSGQFDRKTVVMLAATMANTVRHLMMDQRSIDAVDTALRYAHGEATEEDLSNAALAADAADAADAAAWAAAEAAAAEAAGAAAEAAAAEAAWAAANKRNADIVRELMPNPALVF